MPIKSWGFQHDSNWYRIEAYWRMGGWSYERLFLNHKLVAESSGSSREPLRYNGKEGEPSVMVSFSRRKLGFGKECEVTINGKPLDFEQTDVQIEHPFVARDAEEPPRPIWQIPLGCLVGLFVVPFLLIFIAIINSALFFVRLYRRLVHEPRFRRQMQEKGRFTPWEDLIPRLQSEEGTLILHWTASRALRVWWTPTAISNHCPFPVPLQGNQSSGSPDATSPLNPWCQWHCFSPETGSAILTQPPAHLKEKLFGAVMANPKEIPEQWSSSFPETAIALVFEANPQIAEKIPVFEEAIFEENGINIQKVIELIQSEDRDLAWMSIYALRKIEPPVEAAIPALLERLLHGPWQERWDIAITMACLGPVGVETLVEVANMDDPWVAREAKAGLEYVNFVLSDQPGEKPAT